MAQEEVPPPGGLGAGLACSEQPWQPSGAAVARLLRALAPPRERLGFTAACRAAVLSATHTSEQEASRHLVADL